MSASRMVTGMIGAFGGSAIGRMIGGRTGAMIGSIAGSMLAGRATSGGGGIGDLLGGLLGGDKDQRARAEKVAAAMPEDEAMLLVRAMCYAANADGEVDDEEASRIMDQIDDLDAADQATLRHELTARMDLPGFIASVPRGLEAEVYAASLLPIKVDTVEEVKYLEDLAAGLGLSRDEVKTIHAELGLS